MLLNDSLNMIFALLVAFGFLFMIIIIHHLRADRRISEEYYKKLSDNLREENKHLRRALGLKSLEEDGEYADTP